ncbi:hypothetical protein ACED51_24235 [Photobacterium swingsii]
MMVNFGICAVTGACAQALPDLVEFFLLTLLRDRCVLVNFSEIRMQ